MQLTNKRIFLISIVILLALLALLPGVARADNDPDAEPVVSTIADKLIIQLGPEWAGTEFSLTTDMGVYPGVITVNEAGILTTELGGSTTYTLVCITTPGRQEEAEPVPTDVQPSAQSSQQPEVEILLPSLDVTAQPAAPAQSAQQSDSAEPLAPMPEAEAQSGIPTMHLVLFIGGVALCIVGLIVMRLLKHRNDYFDEDDE